MSTTGWTIGLQRTAHVGRRVAPRSRYQRAKSRLPLRNDPLEVSIELVLVHVGPGGRPRAMSLPPVPYRGRTLASTAQAAGCAPASGGRRRGSTETIVNIAHYSRSPSSTKNDLCLRLAYERCLAIPASDEPAEALKKVR